MNQSTSEPLSPSKKLPVLVFGPSGNGYGLLGMSEHVPRPAVDVFLRFVKVISWRPAKLEAPNAKGLALVPCPDGVFVCRISETKPDSYGRRPTMLVEGIYCPDARSAWQPWMDLSRWPLEILTKSNIASPVKEDAERSAPETGTLPQDWSPQAGTPIVFMSEKLLSMPQSWSAPIFQKHPTPDPTDAPTRKQYQTSPVSPVPPEGSRPMPQHGKATALRCPTLVLGLGCGMALGLFLGILLGYGPMTKSERIKKEAALSVSQNWREAAMLRLSASTPDALDQALVLLLEEKRRLEQVVSAWQDTARKSLNIENPEDLEPKVRQIAKPARD